MRRFFELPPAHPDPAGCVLTIGIFDGVHRGHASVLSETVHRARHLGAASGVVTFDTHPRGHLFGSPPSAITSLQHRLTLFERMGIDFCVILPFSEEIASCGAERFVDDILLARLGMKAIVLGHDSRFGKGGAGNVLLMRQMAESRGFSALCLPPVLAHGKPISSTAIRQAVAEGRLDDAAEMLGRPVAVLGTVTHGSAMGRGLGFPTLNIDPHHELHPPRGVYVTSARAGESVWPSVTNIGHRPTLDAQTSDDLLIETHVLADIGMLYEQQVEVLFHRKLRDELRFSGQEALVRQIREDIAAAHAWFAATDQDAPPAPDA